MNPVGWRHVILAKAPVMKHTLQAAPPLSFLPQIPELTVLSIWRHWLKR